MELQLNLIPLRYDEFKEDITDMKENSDFLISNNEKAIPHVKVNGKYQYFYLYYFILFHFLFCFIFYFFFKGIIYSQFYVINQILLDVIKVDPKYSYSLWASYYEIYKYF